MKATQETYLETLSINLPCPWCKKGNLAFSRDDILRGNDPESLKDLEANPSYLDDYGTFSGKYQCPDCHGTTFTVGEYYYQELEKEIGDEVHSVDVLTLMPKFFTPTVSLINIPQNTPDPLIHELERSFSLYWSDLTGSGNALRVFIERLMDELNIPKTSSSGKDLALHYRIQSFESANPEYANLLMSVKWIGNASSHTSNITKENIDHALEVSEHLLEGLFDRSKQTMFTNAQQIVTTKKPI